MTFRLTSMEPFHILNIQVNNNDLELSQNNQGNKGNNVITKETLILINPLKYNKG